VVICDYLPLYFERKDLMTSVTKFSHQKHLDSPFQLGKYEPECVLTPGTVEDKGTGLKLSLKKVTPFVPRNQCLRTYIFNHYYSTRP